MEEQIPPCDVGETRVLSRTHATCPALEEGGVLDLDHRQGLTGFNREALEDNHTGEEEGSQQCVRDGMALTEPD